MHLAPDLLARTAARARGFTRRPKATFSNTRHVAEQRVVLEHEADLALARVAVRRRPRRGTGRCPQSGVSRPAMMRSSVVLPQPEGPSSATSSPEGNVQADVVQRGEAAEALRDVADFDAHDGCSLRKFRRCLACSPPRLPLDQTLEHQRHQRQASEQRGHGEGGREVVLVVENLDVQRHGVGLAADVPGHDRHRAELAHGAGVAQDHAVEQAPLDVGQRHAPEDLPAGGAEHARRFFLLGALRLHQRDQLARDERKGDEDRRQHDAGHGEDDLDVVRAAARARTSPAAPNIST